MRDVTLRRGLAAPGSVDPAAVIDELRDYLAAVSAQLGVGLESCCWGSEIPAWGYMALDWRLGGRDVALLWDARTGWSVATEPAMGRDLDVVARLDGEVRPQPAAVAEFVATLRSEATPGAITAA